MGPAGLAAMAAICWQIRHTGIEAHVTLRGKITLVDKKTRKKVDWAEFERRSALLAVGSPANLTLGASGPAN